MGMNAHSVGSSQRRCFVRVAIGGLVLGGILCMAALSQDAAPGGWSALGVHHDGDQAVEMSGLSNVVMYHPRVISGGVPRGLGGFEVLRDAGVRTIISVDGAVPDVDMASRAGLRYVHLPIHYGQISDERHVQLARACRDAMQLGGVYVHCHHGQHRSAAAAGVALVSLGMATQEDMLGRMAVSGTSPHYQGLYDAVKGAKCLAAADIEAIDGAFPSVCEPADFTELMVEMNQVMEHLGSIDAAHWRVPKSHPDLVPAAQVAHLVDLYRALGAYTTRSSAEVAWQHAVRSGVEAAQVLEALVTSNALHADEVASHGRLVAIQASCQACHVRFRD